MIKKEKVIQVCGASDCILILTRSKRVYYMGLDVDGQLGTTDNDCVSIPSLIDPKHFDHEKIIQICAGDAHSILLTRNGNVYSCEYGEDGELEHSDKSNKSVPQKMDCNYFNNEPIKYISAGALFSFALTKNNSLYAWGNNYYGQLSLGNDKNQSTPTLANSDAYNNEKIIKIECGYGHVLLLTKKLNGSTHIYSCGLNKHGQLGLGHNDDKNTFQLIDSTHFGNQKIKDIKVGADFSFALVEENESSETKIYSWGLNCHGMLSLGDEENRNTPHEIDSLNFNGEKIVIIGNGSYHSLVITKAKGSNKTKVYAWGDNEEGQLGLGHFDDISKPTPINKKYFKEQSSNSPEQIVCVGGNNGYCGYSFAITKTGKLFTCGYNQYGQLGLNHYKNTNTPQQCCPDLFGISITNQKMYKNQSFEDASFEFC